MHPILARRGRLGPYLLAWLPPAALLAAALRLASDAPWAEAFAVALPLALLYAFVCLASWYPCKAAPLGETPLWRVVATHAVAAATSAFLWLFLAATWVLLIEQAPPFAGAGDRLPASAPVLGAAAVVLWTLAAAVHYLAASVEQRESERRRAVELELLAREAELKALRAQVDPHFLFNTLNAIAALVGSAPVQARAMCLSLADFLRESLRIGQRPAIALGEELDLAARYLEIERHRFGPRLGFEQQVEDPARACAVPPLLLQPLVENAVNRGIAGVVAGGTVRLSARLAGDRVELSISNPCDPDGDRPGTGLGLANVRARLDATWGERASVRAARAGDRFEVHVAFPAEPLATGGRA